MSEELNSPSNGEIENAQAVEPVQTEQPEVSTDDKPAVSAREAVERAFAKVQETKPQEPEPKPTAEKSRDETGKFAKADPKAKPVTDATKTATEVVQAKPATDTKPAPAGFTKAAQDAWAQTPEPVKADIERRLGELTQGIEKYKVSAEAFEPVRKYHDMATKSGTTLEKALDAYVGIETAWRANPAQGFVQVCHNMGVQPGQMLQAIAQGLQGGQVQAPRGDSPEVAALKTQLAQFEQKFGTLEKSFTENQQQIKQREAQGTVEAFAKENPHFDEVADDIAQMLESGYAKDLSDAYAKAVRLNPDVAAKIEAEKTTPDAAQTRAKASKSITGSPTSGSHLGTRDPANSTRDALKNAFAQAGLNI